MRVAYAADCLDCLPVQTSVLPLEEQGFKMSARFRRLLSPPAVMADLSQTGRGVQTLPFVVRPARTAAELQEVAVLRHASYGRHRSQSSGPRPDAIDYAPNAVVLIAIDKASARVVGTIRLVVGDTGPIELEQYVHIPREVTGVPAEAARLVIGRTPKRTLVKLALFKAFYLFCAGHGIDSMVVAARDPVRFDYLWLQFHDLTDTPLWFVPGGDFPDPHQVLMQPIAGLRERWHHASHDFYKILFEMVHPDIRPFVNGGINPLSRLAPAATASMQAELPSFWGTADLRGFIPI